MVEHVCDTATIYAESMDEAMWWAEAQPGVWPSPAAQRERADARTRSIVGATEWQRFVTERGRRNKRLLGGGRSERKFRAKVRADEDEGLGPEWADEALDFGFTPSELLPSSDSA